MRGIVNLKVMIIIGNSNVEVKVLIGFVVDLKVGFGDVMIIMMIGNLIVIIIVEMKWVVVGVWSVEVVVV